MSLKSGKTKSMSGRFLERNYKLFAVNYHGSSLNSIRDEFTKRVKSGIRRCVFVIDVENEIKKQRAAEEAARAAKSPRGMDVRSSGKPTKDGKNKKEPAVHILDKLSIVLAAIETCRTEYDRVTAKIAEEARFDLFKYWVDDLDSKTGTNDLKLRKSALGGKKGLAKIPETGGKTATATAKVLVGDAMICPPLKPRMHNVVGRPELASKRKYIADEPLNSKLFIILVGNFDDKFYLDLLHHSQPLQAIVHFLPQECAYDLMVPHPEQKEFVLQTLEIIQGDIYAMRQMPLTKPVGMFQQELPVISRCLAEKHSQNIYNQLSWYMYDIETLFQHYHLYYQNEFNETNVAMPPSVNVRTLHYTAESLSMQGHFLILALPAIGTDVGTVLTYLESLLSVIAAPDETLYEIETLLADMPRLTSQSIYGDTPVELINKFYNAFGGITKIKKIERLIVDDTNKLLCSLVLYANHLYFYNIYMTCLEYSVQRKYVVNSYAYGAVPYKPYTDDCEPFFLPRYVQVYATEDSTMQNLTQWLLAYDEYQADEIHPGYKLYHFKRAYNEITEDQKMIIIPTRLCFRDFTLFQMDEFIESMITPEMYQEMVEASLTEDEREQIILKKASIFLDPNVFIRPSSLKARKLKEEEAHRGETAKEPASPITGKSIKGEQHPDRKRTKTEEYLSHRQTESKSIGAKIGLPRGHHLLKGYNLEDIRQEILVKTSQYHFEEGFVKLYEDRWCFTDLNKNLEMSISKNKFSWYRPRRRTAHVSERMRVITKSDVAIRILNVPDECAKVVLNYPNGLSVYYHENYAEQLWYTQDTYNFERKRIYTPYGAIIVYFKDVDMILIMRHNGEVYQLYQFIFGEEEGMGEEMSDDAFCKNSDKMNKSNATVVEAEVEITTSTNDIPKPNPEQDCFRKSILHELRYLDFLSSIYGLSYMHLKVTTSIGRIINKTHKGQFFKGRSLQNWEWHDYWANESYVMRSDGVRMIWTKDALKCYHSDGSVITTTTEEGILSIDDLFDEFEEQMEESSSHKEEVASYFTGEVDVVLDAPQILNLQDKLNPQKKKIFKEYIMDEVEGEQEEEDPRYVTYINYTYHMQHRNYAEVYFALSDEYQNEICMDIFAIDDIHIRITNEFTYEEMLLNEMENQSEGFMKNISGTWQTSTNVKAPPESSTTSVNEKTSADEHLAKSIIKIWIGEHMSMVVSDEECEINATLVRYDKEEGKCCDNLCLKFKFSAVITEIFSQLVSSISKFKNYLTSKFDSFYFLEKTDQKCNVQGFRFMERMPCLAKHSLMLSNTICELKPFHSIADKMSNNYDWFVRDMKKFPRFQPPYTRNIKTRPGQELTWVLSCNIYCKIPLLLTNTEDIHKFLQPFDEITYKKTRKHMKKTLDYYVRPYIFQEVSKYASKINWEMRKEEHQRRLFVEQQRKGLYHAMLKHKVYPKYFQFMSDFHGHVKYIDFFDFMRFKCMEKPPEPESIKNTASKHSIHHQAQEVPKVVLEARTAQTELGASISSTISKRQSVGFYQKD